MDIHTSSTTDISSGTPSWFDGKFYKSCMAAWPVVKALGLVVLIGFTWYLSQRDTVAAQSISLIDLQREQKSIRETINERGMQRDKQVQAIENKMVTSQLFDERTNTITQRLERIEKMQEEILMRLPVSR